MDKNNKCQKKRFTRSRGVTSHNHKVLLQCNCPWTFSRSAYRVPLLPVEVGFISTVKLTRFWLEFILCAFFAINPFVFCIFLVVIYFTRLFCGICLITEKISLKKILWVATNLGNLQQNLTTVKVEEKKSLNDWKDIHGPRQGLICLLF
jgi:hypothetical protein